MQHRKKAGAKKKKKKKKKVSYKIQKLMLKMKGCSKLQKIKTKGM